MRLTDLDPRWLIHGGRRVGFIFRCPLPDKNQWWQTCFWEPPPLFGWSDDDDDDYPHGPDCQYGIVARSCPDITVDLLHYVQGCDRAARWSCQPAPEDATFDTISVTPSLDGSRAGNWHGHITNGQIVGGLGGL
jgi:hypothetical protein